MVVQTGKPKCPNEWWYKRGNQNVYLLGNNHFIQHLGEFLPGILFYN